MRFRVRWRERAEQSDEDDDSSTTVRSKPVAAPCAISPEPLSKPEPTIHVRTKAD